MNLSNQLLFFLSAIGAFNSSLLSVYFLGFSKPKSLSNYFLGALLLVLSIRIWKSIFFYFNPDLSKVYLQIGLSACFFIGPFLYLYTYSKVNNVNQFRKPWGLLIGFLLLLVVGTGVLYPYEKYPEIWGNYFYKIINYQWLFFIVLSLRSITPILSALKEKKGKLSYLNVWILSVFFGVTLIWLAYFFASYTSYVLGALTFSFVTYLSILLLFYKRKSGFAFVEKKDKYAKSKIEYAQAENILKDLKDILDGEQLYKNPNLTMHQLATKIKVRPQLLSQVINANLNMSFTSFVNEYRIKEAKILLKSSRNLKMEVIAEQSGFNSSSTFYAVFKKITKTTPAKYTHN